MEVKHKKLVPLTEDPPVMPEGGKPAYKIVMRCVSPHHFGTQVEFSGDSEYIKRFYKMVTSDAMHQIRSGDKTKIIPIIVLEVKVLSQQKV